MENTPPLPAKGLEGDYRLLADFNGTVLAGHPTGQGVEFVTWEWDYSHTGMWQGHYYGNNYYRILSGVWRSAVSMGKDRDQDRTGYGLAAQGRP